MRNRSGNITGNRIATGVAVLLALAVLQGCQRNPYKLTECVGGVPVVERIHDVAPPNC